MVPRVGGEAGELPGGVGARVSEHGVGFVYEQGDRPAALPAPPYGLHQAHDQPGRELPVRGLAQKPLRDSQQNEPAGAYVLVQVEGRLVALRAECPLDHAASQELIYGAEEPGREFLALAVGPLLEVAVLEPLPRLAREALGGDAHPLLAVARTAGVEHLVSKGAVVEELPHIPHVYGAPDPSAIGVQGYDGVPEKRAVEGLEELLRAGLGRGGERADGPLCRLLGLAGQRVPLERVLHRWVEEVDRLTGEQRPARRAGAEVADILYADGGEVAL